MQKARGYILIVIMALVTLVSYFTYFRGYSYPNKLFWDENYHVPNAQRYLNGVHFMEQHPPLGKLLIAAGELILRANQDNAALTGMTWAKALPEGVSMRGYRLLPALCGWLAAPLLFLVFTRLPLSPLTAGLLSALYVFDNAQIVHARSAMLDSILVFFSVALILVFLLLRNDPEARARTLLPRSLLFGALFAAAVATKLTACILILFYPAVIYYLRHRGHAVRQFISASLLGFLLTYGGVWYIHIALGKAVLPTLPEQGYFTKDPVYRSIVASGKGASPANLFHVWRAQQFIFPSQHNDRVPKLNLCKAKEDGSPAYFWPFGARAINYRWERAEAEPGKFRYLYLQCNPAVWMLSLAAVLLSAALLVVPIFVPLGTKIGNKGLIFLFLSLYLGYIAAVLLLDRVMYLYHYFLPLVFSFLLVALAGAELRRIGPFRLSAPRKQWLLALVAAVMAAVYWIYSPLTYYRPLSDEQVKRRAIFPLWDLRCVHCPRQQHLAFPVREPLAKNAPFGQLRLGGLAPEFGMQSWGSPRLSQSVVGKPLIVGERQFQRGFGVHAKSVLRYRLDGEYERFRGLVGLPDYLAEVGGRVVFKVIVDGASVWESGILTPGLAAQPVDVSLKGAKLLELQVEDGGDGTTHDHAVWLEPELLHR